MVPPSPSRMSHRGTGWPVAGMHVVKDDGAVRKKMTNDRKITSAQQNIRRGLFCIREGRVARSENGCAKRRWPDGDHTSPQVVGVSFLSVTYRAPKKTNRFTEFEFMLKLSCDHELGKSARDRRPEAPNPKRFVPLLTQLHLRQVRQENALLTTFH